MVPLVVQLVQMAKMVMPMVPLVVQLVQMVKMVMPMVPLVVQLVQMVKMVPLVPMLMAPMLPTDGAIGRTPNTRNIYNCSFSLNPRP